MMRKLMLGVVAFGLLAVVGCEKSATSRAGDMGTKGSPPIDPKTGKASKVIEATFEEPKK
jgi:hypothetical protein